MAINQYNLFSEFLSNYIYGETFSDAIMREGTLTSKKGQIKIKRIVQTIDTSNSERGGRKYQSLLVETYEGKYTHIDAVEMRIFEAKQQAA